MRIRFVCPKPRKSGTFYVRLGCGARKTVSATLPTIAGQPSRAFPPTYRTSFRTLHSLRRRISGKSNSPEIVGGRRITEATEGSGSQTPEAGNADPDSSERQGLDFFNSRPAVAVMAAAVATGSPKVEMVEGEI
jgi:hypothetical protein